MEAAPEPKSGDTLAFAQTGAMGPLIGLSIKIFLLNIITLTLYRFWGRAEVRRYLWGTTTINGEPLEYTGTGTELFLGFLFTVLFILLPFGAALYAIIYLLPPKSAEFTVAVLVLEIAFLLLFPFGYYRAWRYRLSRTTWRGVRFALEGKGYAYTLKAVLLFILSVFTAYLAAPLMDALLTNHLLGRMSFGDRTFRAQAKARSLYLAFLMTALLIVVIYAGIITAILQLVGLDVISGKRMPTVSEILPLYAIFFAGGFLGHLAVCIYLARRLTVFGSGLSLDGVQFSLHATWPSYFMLTFTNALLVLFTLGLAMPIAELRRFRYLFSRLKANGTIDLAAVVQSNADRPARGEGLAEAFGFGTV